MRLTQENATEYFNEVKGYRETKAISEEDFKHLMLFGIKELLKQQVEGVL